MSEVRFRVHSSGGEGGNMQVVYRRCGGLDVHKDTITATVLVFGEDGNREVRKKQFGTHWKELQRFGKWLRACRVERVAMESTGVYWKPVWNVLERSLPMVLANPYQVKNIPSRKTDRLDSEWIADLLAHDLIRPSFVPSAEIRQLRELTRYRVQLTGERNRVHNRIHKVLEDANVKLESTQKTVATLSIPANSVSQIDLPEPLSDSPGAKSLLIETDAGPGETLSDVEAVFQSNVGPVASTLPWKDRDQTENGGEHPWTVGRSESSTVILFNPDPHSKNDYVQVFIRAGEVTWTKRLSVSPLATQEVSIDNIIAQQQKDDKGITLSQNYTRGIVTWATLSNPRVFGKLVQFDKGLGVQRTYACGSTVINCGATLSPGADALIASQQDSFIVQSVQACQGDGSCGCIDACGDEFGSPTYFQWGSGNSGIASLVSDPTSGEATYAANAVGETSASVILTDNSGCATGGNAEIDVASNLGQLYDLSAGYSPDNLNIDQLVTYEASYGDTIDGYTTAMGFQTSPLAAPSTYPGPSIWIEAGEAAATGNLAAAAAVGLLGVLAYVLDGQWQELNQAQCEEQYANDINTCFSRFPSDGSKRSACYKHAMVRYVQCMKGLPIPPLQPTN